jgi:hypothetical protein
VQLWPSYPPALSLLSCPDDSTLYSAAQLDAAYERLYVAAQWLSIECETTLESHLDALDARKSGAGSLIQIGPERGHSVAHGPGEALQRNPMPLSPPVGLLLCGMRYATRRRSAFQPPKPPRKTGSLPLAGPVGLLDGEVL